MALAAVFVLAVLVLVVLVIVHARKVNRPLQLRPARPRPSHASPTGRLARGSQPPYPATTTSEDDTEPLPMMYVDTDEMKTEEPSTVIIDHDQLYGG